MTVILTEFWLQTTVNGSYYSEPSLWWNSNQDMLDAVPHEYGVTDRIEKPRVHGTWYWIPEGQDREVWQDSNISFFFNWLLECTDCLNVKIFYFIWQWEGHSIIVVLYIWRLIVIQQVLDLDDKRWSNFLLFWMTLSGYIMWESPWTDFLRDYWQFWMWKLAVKDCKFV